MNKILFEDLSRNDAQIVTNIIMAIKEHVGSNDGDRMDYILCLVYFDNTTIRFCDGVVAGAMCGIGVFLKLNTNHVYRAYFAGGEGNNIKEEILGLWGLRFFSKRL